MNRMEFVTASARHGLRTDLLLVSVLVMSTASTASLRSSLRHKAWSGFWRLRSGTRGRVQDSSEGLWGSD